MILLREGDEASRCCWSSATPRSGSWAARGCSPAAPSTARGRGRPGARGGRRELREEAGVELGDPARSCASPAGSRPAQVKVRFDTHFFVAARAGRRRPASRRRRVRRLALGHPQERSTRPRTTSMLLFFPTLKHLEQLAEHASVEDALRTARQRKVHAGRAAGGGRGRRRPGAAAGRGGLRGSATRDDRRRVQVGLVMALVTAFTSIVGFLYKHRGAVESPPVEARRPVSTSLALFRSPWYTLGSRWRWARGASTWPRWPSRRSRSCSR